jgi:Type I 3-dehydroquinase
MVLMMPRIPWLDSSLGDRQLKIGNLKGLPLLARNPIVNPRISLDRSVRTAMSKSSGPRIFVTLAAPTLAAMEAQASGIAGSQIGYELRLDYLQQWQNFDRELHEMLERIRAPHAIATCRRVEAGGLFSGSVDEQLDRLEAASRAGCHRVDI